MKPFGELPSMWEMDGVTAASFNDLTIPRSIHVINSRNKTKKESDLAFPFLPSPYAISTFWTLLQA